jgi:acetolactate synthase-1/2/3 large subunit
MSTVVGWLSDHLSDDAIVCNGAGNYTVWVHRFYRYKHPRTELAPISGAMGYGVPAGVAAALRFPKRTVVAIRRGWLLHDVSPGTGHGGAT